MQLRIGVAAFVCVLGVCLVHLGGAQDSEATAFTNGRWFNGTNFDLRPAVYSVKTRLSFIAPSRVAQTIDLNGAWVIPPFADAHNHNISNGATEEADRRAVAKFLTDGVLYVKIPGNVPLPDEARQRLRINTEDGLEVSFGNGSLTSSKGHPIPLVTSAAATGAFAGHSADSLRDLRYFVTDSEAELNTRWPRILNLRPDFRKAMLVFSEDHARYEQDHRSIHHSTGEPRAKA